MLQFVFPQKIIFIDLTGNSFAVVSQFVYSQNSVIAFSNNFRFFCKLISVIFWDLNCILFYQRAFPISFIVYFIKLISQLRDETILFFWMASFVSLLTVFLNLNVSNIVFSFSFGSPFLELCKISKKNELLTIYLAQ